MNAIDVSTSNPPQSRAVPKSLLIAGILLGLGFAGFFDGIVLHQILQWHHMLSNVHPMHSLEDVKVNTLADGLFHLFSYGLTIAGVVMLWQSFSASRSELHQQSEFPKSSQPLIGAILVGAGFFNFVEGLIDHQILGIHHVRSGSHYIVWDMGFLILGASLIGLGILLIQRWKKTAH